MTEKYFKSLNYTLANEDSWPEVRMVELLKPKKILSVAGSGGRCLPLLVGHPAELICVDLSSEQLALVNLRKETILKLSLEDFHLFWGYPAHNTEASNEKRKTIFKSLDLPAEDRKFFADLFEARKWGTILYAGKWENTFVTFSKVSKLFLSQKVKDTLVTFTTQEEQIRYVETQFPKLRWKLLLKVLGNAAIFNALLYKGHFIEKNVSDTHFEYYSKAFHRIFTQTLIRKNFFAQLCFFGEIIHPEGIPVEGDRRIFDLMKSWFKGGNKLILLSGNILELIPNQAEISGIDFLSFSDVPSYFTGEVERKYLQTIRPKMASGGVVVVRNYLREALELDQTGFEDVTSKYLDLFVDEKVQMYMIKVYKKV